MAINFSAYEYLKIWVTQQEDGRPPGTLGRLVCGALAGSISQTVRAFPFRELFLEGI